MNYDEKTLVYKMFNSLPKQKGTLDNQRPDSFLKTQYYPHHVEKAGTNRKGTSTISTKRNSISWS